MNTYTIEQWSSDGTFKAVPGQQIGESVYNHMLNCMPPKDLPSGTARQALSDFGIPVHAGFLMGEPYDADKNGRPRYMAFGMNDYGKGKKFYYLGLSTAAPVLHGKYYYLDCMNAFASGGLFPAEDFRNEDEAIDFAANYEATLIRIEYDHGRRVESKTVYDPWSIFDRKEAEA